MKRLYFLVPDVASTKKIVDELLMVDVPMDRVDEFIELIKQHHSKADVRGTEPLIPAFP